MTSPLAKILLPVLGVAGLVFVPVVQAEENFSGNKYSLLQNSEYGIEIVFPEPKFFKPLKPRTDEKPLSLVERQRRADIESVRREKNFLAQNSPLGRLKAEMEQEPLKSYQGKLTEFSEKIKTLLAQLKGKTNVERSVFLDLGSTYLESHRFFNSLSAEDRWKLTRYAVHSGTLLGSNESALWVFKMVLTRNPNDGETNLTLGEILSEMGEWDLALRRARNAERLFVENNQPDKAVKAQSLIDGISNK